MSFLAGFSKGMFGSFNKAREEERKAEAAAAMRALERQDKLDAEKRANREWERRQGIEAEAEQKAAERRAAIEVGVSAQEYYRDLEKEKLKSRLRKEETEAELKLKGAGSNYKNPVKMYAINGPDNVAIPRIFPGNEQHRLDPAVVNKFIAQAAGDFEYAYENNDESAKTEISTALSSYISSGDYIKSISRDAPDSAIETVANPLVTLGVNIKNKEARNEFYTIVAKALNADPALVGVTPETAGWKITRDNKIKHTAHPSVPAQKDDGSMVYPSWVTKEDVPSDKNPYVGAAQYLSQQGGYADVNSAFSAAAYLADNIAVANGKEQSNDADKQNALQRLASASTLLADVYRSDDPTLKNGDFSQSPTTRAALKKVLDGVPASVQGKFIQSIIPTQKELAVVSAGQNKFKTVPIGGDLNMTGEQAMNFASANFGIKDAREAGVFANTYREIAELYRLKEKGYSPAQIKAANVKATLRGMAEFADQIMMEFPDASEKLRTIVSTYANSGLDNATQDVVLQNTIDLSILYKKVSLIQGGADARAIALAEIERTANAIGIGGWTPTQSLIKASRAEQQYYNQKAAAFSLVNQGLSGAPGVSRRQALVAAKTIDTLYTRGELYAQAGETMQTVTRPAASGSNIPGAGGPPSNLRDNEEFID